MTILLSSNSNELEGSERLCEEFPRWVKPGKSFSVLTLLAQLAFLCIFFNGSDKAMMIRMDSASYSCYIGISLMMLVGFGYLKAFLKAYGLGAVGFTLLIISLGLQWAMILDCKLRQVRNTFKDLNQEIRTLLIRSY